MLPEPKPGGGGVAQKVGLYLVPPIETQILLREGESSHYVPTTYYIYRCLYKISFNPPNSII